MREVLAAYLTVDGWIVTEAVDGQLGLEAAAVHRPDLIVTDIMMPNLDGLSMVRRLREDAMLRHIPVLLVSGHPAPELDFEPGGPVTYIAKPVTLGTFLRAIRELLATSA